MEEEGRSRWKTKETKMRDKKERLKKTMKVKMRQR